MSQSPDTRATLLIKVRQNQDEQAWNEFVEIYAPLVYAYGRRRGLQDADAADLAQDVLQSVSTAVKAFEYDPQRGSFRGWLLTITLNRIRQTMNRHHRQTQGTGDSAVQAILQQQPASRSDEEAWEREHELRLFHWAAEGVRDSFEEATWQAFWQTAVEHQSPGSVAEGLGISTGAVYIAKSRVMARIRKKIETVEAIN